MRPSKVLCCWEPLLAWCCFCDRRPPLGGTWRGHSAWWACSCCRWPRPYFRRGECHFYRNGCRNRSWFRHLRSCLSTIGLLGHFPLTRTTARRWQIPNVNWPQPKFHWCNRASPTPTSFQVRFHPLCQSPRSTDLIGRHFRYGSHLYGRLDSWSH